MRIDTDLAYASAAGSLCGATLAR